MILYEIKTRHSFVETCILNNKSLGSSKGLLEVRLDVVDVLDADGYTYQLRLDSGRKLLRRRQLLVRG